MSSIISVKDVSKYFDLPKEKSNSLKQLLVHPERFFGSNSTQQIALHDVSFEVEEGEFFGIVGKNGSGKSTLLKLLAGIYQPNKGSIEVRGSIMPFIELGVGFNAELTGRENVFLSGALLGFSQQEMQERYPAIVDFAELEDFMDQKLKNYSSGMQVRLAFSIATQVKADVFLIDEVLAVGDSAFRRKCYNYFKQLKRDQRTVIFITHDMDAVNEYCDRAMLIDDGTIKCSGPPEKVAEEYVRLFAAPSQEDEAHHSADRWGDKRTTYTKVKAEVTAEKIVVKADFKATKDTEGALLGIRINAADGRPITGTNTKLEDITVNDLKAGDRGRVTWTLPNVFSEGTYTLDPAIVSDDGVDVYDWWNGAVSFEVHRSRHIPYPIDPQFNVTLEYHS